MRKLVFQLCALCVLICCTAQAQQKPCSQAEQDQVGKEASSLRTWDALYKSYRQFKHCWNHVDNVEADEGYSESIARILTDHWETLTRLAQLIQKDRGFGKFVGLSDIDNIEDLEKIRGNAIQHCPAGLSGLCAKLKKDADQSIGAIEDDAASRKHN